MELLGGSLWPGLVLWVLLYISDYALTLACSRLYHTGVNEVMVIEGSYEITPYYQADVDALRRLSPRFLVATAWGVLLLAFSWWLSGRARSAVPGFCLLMLGALTLPQLPVHIRHFRNLALFRRTAAGMGMRGRVEYPRALMLDLSAVEVLGFVVLYAFCFALTLQVFFLGGVLVLAVLAFKHWRLARKARAKARSS